jgi:hypothetical protein
MRYPSFKSAKKEKEGMPFVRQRPDLNLTSQVYDELVKISKSRTEKASRVERAKMLILYHDGVSISAIARKLSTNRPKVERCIDKALQLGALTALDDYPGLESLRQLPLKQEPGSLTWPAKSQKHWDILLSCGPIVFLQNISVSIVWKQDTHALQKLAGGQSQRYFKRATFVPTKLPTTWSDVILHLIRKWCRYFMFIRK